MAETIDLLRAAQQLGRVVRICRDAIDPENAEVVGIVAACSSDFAVVKTVDADLLLNGFAAVAVGDITHVDLEFERDFFTALAEVCEWPPLRSPALDLASMRSLLESANASFPLIGLHCEMSDPFAFEAGRIQMITDESVVLGRVDEWANAVPVSEPRRFADITCVSFGSLHLQNLWSVAMRLGRFDAKH
jgi:hypothetical protein